MKCLLLLEVDKELLGELQFSFICFFLAHGWCCIYKPAVALQSIYTYVVYDAFEHWKELVRLLCLSERALSTHKDLFTSFISKHYCYVCVCIL